MLISGLAALETSCITKQNSNLASIHDALRHCILFTLWVMQF